MKRLPRKSSKGYDLQKDTNTFFREVFRNINYSEFAGRYKVFITVKKDKTRWEVQISTTIQKQFLMVLQTQKKSGKMIKL